MTETKALRLTQAEKSAFLVRTYAWMAFALFLSAVAAYFTATHMYIQTEEGITTLSAFGKMLFGNSGYGFIALCVLEIVIVCVISAAIRKLSVFAATTLYVLYSVVNGLTLSSIFAVYEINSICTAFFSTALTFLVMCIYGAKTGADLTKVGRYLVMALVGIILASILQFVLGLITGAPLAMLDLLINIATVIVFTGLTAYDSQKIIKTAEYAKNTDDYKKVALLGALELYLDFINLFLALLRLFGKRKN